MNTDYLIKKITNSETYRYLTNQPNPISQQKLNKAKKRKKKQKSLKHHRH